MCVCTCMNHILSYIIVYTILDCPILSNIILYYTMFPIGTQWQPFQCGIYSSIVLFYQLLETEAHTL